MTRWHNLYLFYADRNHNRAVDTLKTSLTDLGYTLYNPFGVMPGLSYPRAVRLFVAPTADPVRIIGTPDTQQLPLLSRSGTVLSVGLAGDEATITVYSDGDPVDPQSALVNHLRAGNTPDDLSRALHGDSLDLPPLEESESPQVVAVPLDALPEDVQEMAQDVDLSQAQQMFDKIGGKLLQDVQRGDAEAARKLLGGGEDAPDWNSAGGQRLRALMACLDLPQNWLAPDFVTLRDAYQLHARKQRKPTARLYPGDAEAMAAVPDALDYLPVYGGMKA